MLSLTVDTGLKSNTIKPSSLREVVVDSTVMEKNIAHPTDSKLLEKCRDKLVGFAKQAGIRLRQSYERIGPRTAQKVAHYTHAKQFKRMKKTLKKQKNLCGLPICQQMLIVYLRLNRILMFELFMGSYSRLIDIFGTGVQIYTESS